MNYRGILWILVALCVSEGFAAQVGNGGYSNNFSAQPAATDWAMVSVSGAGGDTYDMDSDVNNRITASLVTSQPAMDSGNPPSQSGSAIWSSTGLYLQTRPTANRYTAVMAKFVNNTGSNWPQITFSYTFTIAANGGVPEETGKGTRVYYSLTGLLNSWTNIPALNSTNSANGSTTYRAALPVGWPNGGNLFLLWADDNAVSGGFDSGNQIDNFSLPERDEFLAMLDELESAATPFLRGFDQGINSFNNIGNRVVKQIGSAETWDAYGTADLRAAVLARWRSRYLVEGNSMLHGLVRPAALSGQVEVNAGGVHFDRGVADMRTGFFLNNGKLYEMGTMDGAFPPMAFMLGDQSGIWAPPIKALDGFEFIVREALATNWRLADSPKFSHDFASATFRYASNGWLAERIDFPSHTGRGLFSRLTLSNTTTFARTFDVDFVARINVRPDWRTGAQKNQQNTLDVIQVTQGLVQAWDDHLPKSALLLGADRPADSVSVTAPLATMTHHLTVPANGSVTMNFLLLAGLEPGDTNGPSAFYDLVVRSEAELAAARLQMSNRIGGGTAFSCSDQRLTEAFTFSKANLALLTADYRPYFPDIYLAAGVPVYPRLFANDSCMSLPGAMAAGFMNETRGTIACLASQTQTHLSLTPHESATDAEQIGPANAQETPQFIATCARYLRWSGDHNFISRIYPELKKALAAQRGKDTDGDGYPEGGALIESGGMGPEKVDAACWQYAALSGLAEIATALGYAADAASFSAEASALRSAIQRDWWVPANAMWADSLGATNQPLFAGAWSVVFPLLTGVATEAQAQLTLAGLQSGWVNQWGGVHTRAPDVSGTGSGVVTTELFASAAFGYGQADFGLRMLQLAAKAPRQARLPGGCSETIPPGGSDFVQLWSAGPFLEAVVDGLGGVLPAVTPHQADFVPLLPPGLEWLKLEHLKVGGHEFTLEHRRTKLQRVITLRHENGPSAFNVRFFASSNAQFSVNGALIPSQVTTNAPRIGGGRVASCALSVGESLLVTFRDTTPLPFELVQPDSEWKFLDDGSDQGTAWRGTTFNDRAWQSGHAEFGYGDGDEVTFVRANRADSSRIITTYFRKAFFATNRWAVSNLTLNVMRDDGVLVFLNGTEVFRNNMPGGPVTYLTTALNSVNGGNEALFYSVNVDPNLLVDGTNVLAAEIHQQSTSSSDISFNLELSATVLYFAELSIRPSAPSGVELRWPLIPRGFAVESAPAPIPKTSWQPEPNLPTVTNGENVVWINVPPFANRFFRLQRVE